MSPKTQPAVKFHKTRRDLSAARSMWEGLGREHADNWSIQHDLGDFCMLAGEYTEAKAYYRKAIELMDKPRYTDPVDSLALVCEMDGDITGAIEARELELTISEKEWDIAYGEGVDSVKREIARLQKLL